ncbi:MAG: winged helix-turn-helix transcriptional regulator [Candidatus Diapherotrites archaeon]|nr:winged helix-turn-helix transcriptional regulator [Candidatus Diapherotrites archaeon]
MQRYTYCEVATLFLLKNYTATQRKLLLELQQTQGGNVTALARELSQRTGTALSTVKYAIKKFKKEGVVNVHVGQQGLTKVYLTEEGYALVERLYELRGGDSQDELNKEILIPTSFTLTPKTA